MRSDPLFEGRLHGIGSTRILWTFSSALAKKLSHVSLDPLKSCSLMDTVSHLCLPSLSCQQRPVNFIASLLIHTSFLDPLLMRPFWNWIHTGSFSKMISFG